MPDELDGLLSQDDIDAALAAGGMADDGGGQAGASPAATATADPPQDTRFDSGGRPFDEVAAAMAAAIDAENTAGTPPAGSPDARSVPRAARPLEIPVIGSPGGTGPGLQGIDLLRDVDLNVKIELGRCRMLVDDVLRLKEGSVVELDKLAGDPVDVFVNNRLVARGEVLVLNDNFCVRISDIISRDFEEAEQDS